jgi:uncharacterized protein (DUF58 family)
MRARAMSAGVRPLFVFGVLALALAQTGALPVLAAEDPVFAIEMNDGAVTPARLEVPADRRIVLEIRNTGTSPAEFESKDLRKEVVLSPGGKSSLVIRRLDRGEYAFFDEFHPGTTAVLVAK